MNDSELLAALNTLVQRGLVDVVNADGANLEVRLSRAITEPSSTSR